MAASAGIVAIFLSWLVFDWGGKTATHWFFDTIDLPVCAAVAAACGHAAWKARGRTGAAWALIGLGVLSWGVGQAVWAYEELVKHQELPFPSWADAGYLGFIPLAATGLLLYPTRSHWLTGLRSALDGVIVACSALYITWVVLLAPALAAPESDIPAVVLSLAYPLGDVIIVTILFLALGHVGRLRAPLLLVGCGVLLFVVADALFVVQAAGGTYVAGAPIDLGWTAGFLLIGLGAMHPDAGQRVGHNGAREPLRIALLPYVPLGAALAVAVGRQVVNAPADPLGALLLALAIFVLFVRQFFALIENHQLSDRLNETYERLRAAEESRLRLLNTIVHDLRAPLSPINLQLDLLRRRIGEEPRTVKGLQVVERNVKQMTRLIEDLSAFSRMQAGHFAIHPQSTDLAQLAAETCATFQDTAKSRGIHLACSIPDPMPIEGDPDRLTQVLYNLIGNALKFTPAGGGVTVTARATPDGWTFEVSDTGRGLAPDEIPRLFRPFVQTHRDDEAHETGSGLGLYISRTIIEAHGGAISCTSPGLGHGATFCVRLPRNAAAPSAGTAPAPFSPVEMREQPPSPAGFLGRAPNEH